MKKAIAMLLAMTMLLCGGLGAIAEEMQEEEVIEVAGFDQVEDEIGVQRGTELVIGSTTAMGGYFGTDVWGSNTADMDVRSILHGYSTVAWTRTLGLAMNSVSVTAVETNGESDGSRVYTIHIQEGLTYNDGSPITAQDYVFSVLLGGSPALKEIGGTPKGMNHIVGYNAYAMGQAESIEGVRLLSDTSFSLHVSAEYLPFFYGLAMLNVTPYPISVIAPGCEVRDDGEGAYLAAAENAAELAAEGYTPGEFSAEMLTVTMLDEETGYEHNPRVTSGPYALEAFDRAAGEATFVINENFRGNYEGQRPHIERIVLKHVENSAMVDQLASGEVTLLNKVANGSAIAQGQALVQEGRAQAATYLRTGFSFLAFACEYGPTSSAAVRKAIAMCLDKDTLTAQVAGGSARRVYGYYGLGQWMATYTISGEGGGQPLNLPEELAKLDVRQDLTGAKALLDSDGWNLNEAGEPFVEGTDEVRYREGEDGLEALIIQWAKTEDSGVADALEEALTSTMASVGMKLEVTEMPFNEMLTYYYRQAPRTYNMFYLASNFTYVFDPYYDFNVADTYQGMINTSGLKDEQLMLMALQMRETPSMDMNGYASKWLDFQKRFVEVMPMVPLYSNVYFDFSVPDLQDYDIASHSGWGLALPYAYFANVEPAPEGEPEEAPEGETPPEEGETPPEGAEGEAPVEEQEPVPEEIEDNAQALVEESGDDVIEIVE